MRAWWFQGMPWRVQNPESRPVWIVGVNQYLQLGVAKSQVGRLSESALVWSLAATRSSVVPASFWLTFARTNLMRNRSAPPPCFSRVPRSSMSVAILACQFPPAPETSQDLSSCSRHTALSVRVGPRFHGSSTLNRLSSCRHLFCACYQRFGPLPLQHHIDLYSHWRSCSHFQDARQVC